jgi:ubiquitin-protein ligase
MEGKPKAKIQNKRIMKEVKMLKNLDMLFGKIEKDDGVLIRIEIQASTINSQFLSNDIEKLYFEVFLTEKFPFQAPQVYCKSKFVFPTIDDKRDVLEEVIKKEWSPSMTIYETVQLIPEFVSEILLQSQQDDEVKSIGKWHLGMFYNIQEFGVGVFKVREEKETMDGFSYYDRYIAVCENSFFLFEPIGKKHKLISVATLCSLEKIIRNLDMPEYVTFVWRRVGNNR